MGLAAFLGLLATLVLAARPGAAVNRTFAALLVLQGAATLVFEMMREAGSAEAAIAFGRAANWYYFPVAFVTFALLIQLFPSPRRRPLDLAVLGGLGALTVGLWAAQLLAPDLVIAGVRRSLPGEFFLNPGPLALAAGVTINLVYAAALVLSAMAALSPERSAAQRRQAALVGLAFTMLAGWAGATLATGLILRPASIVEPLRFVYFASGGVVIAAVLLCLRPLASAFEPRWRALVMGSGLLPVAAGVFDIGVPLLGALQSIGVVYRNSGVVWVSAWAAVLAIALVRFGLAGFGASMRRRVATLSHAALVAVAMMLPAGLALQVAGLGATGLLLALFLALGAAALSPVPMRPLAARLARLLVVEPHDPDAVGERVRVYAAALERHLVGGTPHLEEGTTLRELRRELDISEREHALLLASVTRSRGAAGDAPPLLGRYRVERELGRGAFGSALLAEDAASGEHVVLKRFHRGASERRVMAEARALAAVRHPRVVPLHGVERVGEEVFLVLGYAAGGSARTLLEREGALSVARACALADDVLQGLAALHAAGLVHRDVKPSNVLLDEDGRGLLGDFGSARFVTAEVEATMTGAEVLGSYATLAPEVVAGGAATASADLYAVGAVLYRLLTGEHYVALDGRNAFQVRQAILHAPPRLPHPRVPAAVGDVIARALAKAPDERFKDAEAMRHALGAAVAEPLGPSRDDHAAHRPARRRVGPARGSARAG